MLNGFFQSTRFSELYGQCTNNQYSSQQFCIKLQKLLIIAKTGNASYLCPLILNHGNNPGIIAEIDRFSERP